MTVRTTVEYQGDLHCEAIHGPSGDRILTDAPVDNQGRGEHFSPTDLVAAAIGSCMLTIMGIAARRRGIDMNGAKARVDKRMGKAPRRHITTLSVEIALPSHIGQADRDLLEHTARACPVAASLGSSTAIDLRFRHALE